MMHVFFQMAGVLEGGRQALDDAAAALRAAFRIEGAARD
jgi:hypothetical protein